MLIDYIEKFLNSNYLHKKVEIKSIYLLVFVILVGKAKVIKYAFVLLQICAVCKNFNF
ncbi:MAG: hypothetical protein LBU14_03135 [Candidatus Peribacteria bacterium]|nr:hypothetical protein [Candidatus Peribacteria bacterium]